MCERIHTIDKNTDGIVAASKGFVVDLNAYKTKYMIMYLHQNEGRNKLQEEIKGDGNREKLVII
jgi:hypothetical protein